MAYPKQVRSVDPYDTERWSTIYNLRSRIITGGEDKILHATESFTMTYGNGDDGEEITVGPGIFIKDDNLVHITEDTVMKTNIAIPKWVLDSDLSFLNQNNDPAYLFIDYQYERTYPPKQARYIWMKDLTPYVTTPQQYIYLGRVTFSSGLIDEIDMLAYNADNPLGGLVLLERPNWIPWCGNTGGNGGVIRDGGWYEDWS